jgi:hypothetical protein
MSEVKSREEASGGREVHTVRAEYRVRVPGKGEKANEVR